MPAYAASKGGVAQLTKALANEWAGKGVNVNAIAPGYIHTDNTAALAADPVRNQQIAVRIPAGRWGEPADLGGAAVFLASRARATTSTATCWSSTADGWEGDGIDDRRRQADRQERARLPLRRRSAWAR